MLSKVVNELLSKISQLVVDSKGDREAQKFLKRVECKFDLMNHDISKFVVFIIEKESNAVDDIDYDSDVENFYSDDSENDDAENEEFAPEKTNRGKRTQLESFHDLDTLKAIIQLKDDEGWSFKRIRDRYTKLPEYSCVISRLIYL
jgi:predicted neutral ceramidase superfamily lipid hydrolase